VRVRAIGEFFLKQKKRRSRELEFLDPEFLEALYEEDSASHSPDRKTQRKALQFCRQVQRALNLALTDSEEVLGDLFVEEVVPAPDCGRLLVHVVIPANSSIAEVMSSLRRITPALRAEVARAITRKRAPELLFAPLPSRGGVDE
jgi:ribosome-binding factor A